MSTSEEKDLQLLHKDGEEPMVANNPEEQKLPKQLQPAKGAVSHVNPWKKISLIVLIMLAYAFLNAAISTVTVFYATVAEYHSVPTYISGFVIGVPNLCLAILAPLGGCFLPHLGLKFTQVAGLFLSAGSQLLFGFVSKMPTPTLFITFSFLLKVVEGIGLTMFCTASTAVLIQLFSQTKGTLGSVISVPVVIGFAIGVPVAGGLQEVGGFVLPFLVFGGMTLFLTLLLLINVHPTECTREKVPWRIILKMLHNVLFVLLVLGAVISMGTYYLLMSFFGRFLSTHFGLGMGITGLIYMSGFIIITLASISAGPIADKLKISRYLIIGGLVVGFAGCVMIGPAKFITAPKLWLSTLAWIVLQPGVAFAIVPVYSAIFETLKTLHIGEEVLASTLSGVFVTSFGVGQFLGPVIGGVLVYHIGFQWMAAMSGQILLIYALVLVVATAIQKIWERKMNTTK